MEVRLDEVELEERIDELELITDDEERNDEDEGREEGIELDEGTLDEIALEDGGGVVPQIDPVTAGASITAPLEFT